MAKIMKGNLQLNIKTYIIGLMLVGIVICFSSCQDKDEFTPDPISGDVNEFYADVQGSHEWDSFDAATDHIFITDNNTSVHIPANSLVYDDGSDVVGEISVSLQDYLNMGELIVHNVSAMMSSDRMLSSEGVLFVSFAQGNEVLSVKPESLVTIRVPEPNASVDAILYDDGGEPIVFDWQVSGDTMSLKSWDFYWDGKDWIDSGYEFYITGSGWYNIALELNPDVSFNQPICVSLPRELFDGINSDVFLILDEYDTVVPLEMNSEKMLFCASFSNLPQDSDATIVSISSLGEGNYHFGMSHAIINMDNSELVVVPEPQTKEQILDFLGMF